MRSLIFIVEGETEWEFVKKIIIPYLVENRGVNAGMDIVMVTKGGGGHGYSNIDHFKNTVLPIMNRSDEPIITTLLDHYGINSEQKLPGFSACVKFSNVNERISKMESCLNDCLQSWKSYRFFIPYIQRHEMETLLLANPEEGFYMDGEKITNDVISLCNEFESIEDINCTPQGAPSKRLEAIYSRHSKKYNKGVDATDIAIMTGIEAMLDKCPRFKNWLDKLVETVSAS